MCSLLAFGVASVLQFPAANSTEKSEQRWVVRDVFGHDGAPAGYDRGWSFAGGMSAQGELDRDGAVDLLLSRHDNAPWNPNSRSSLLYSLRGLHQTTVIIDQRINEWLNISSDMPYMYRAPASLLLHARGTPFNGWDGGHSFSLPRTIVASDVNQYWHWIRGFDIDSDGYEELIAEIKDNYGNVVTDCLDGRTLLPKWRSTRFFPIAFPAYLTMNDPLGWPDLDQDGFPDYVSAWKRWRPNRQDFDLSLSIYEGRQGAPIWSVVKSGIHSANATVTWGPDISGDGLADFVVCDPVAMSYISAQVPGLISVLSGADGSLIWERTFLELAPTLRLKGHAAEALGWMAGFSRPFEGRGPADILLTVDFRDLQSPTGAGQQRTVMLDARTGSTATVAEEPMDAEPWYRDSYGGIPYYHSYPGAARNVLGDVDRDGFNEMATASMLWSVDDPNILGPPTALLILGRQTLHVPETARIGEEMRARLHIPSAPGHDFRLLLSQGFDRSGGQSVDGWRTYLEADALLAKTLGGRYSGTLDADGRGVLDIRIPNQPALSGTTLYSKAVILKPGSATEVWTLSSLGLTHLL